MGPRAQLLISEAELIREILTNRDKIYTKGDFQFYIKKLLGDGIFTSDGEKWSKMRKLANYAFHTENLKVINILLSKNSNCLHAIKIK